jgi:L-rhamnose-H+ transport protein
VWGVSAVLFGLGISRVGLALGFGIILGVSSSLGAIVPLLKLHRDRLFTTAGLLAFVGVAVIVGGVVASARAGLLREASSMRRRGNDSFNLGLVICVLSGIGSMFMSLALNEAQPIFGAAEAMGTSASHAMNAVWPVLLGGGFAVNGGYCAYRLMRRHSTVHFGSATTMNLALTSAMAVLWSGSNFLYGAGARGMGSLGLVLAWPVFMAAIVLTANSWGVLTDEWRGAGTRAGCWAFVGIVFLIVGICVLTSAERAS